VAARQPEPEPETSQESDATMAYTPVGREIDRIEGRLKVTGAAQYSGDYPAPAMAHAYLITSSIGLGRIRAMDTAAALDAPGVLDVYSPFNPLRLYVMPGLGENYAPLQDAEVRGAVAS
jgi:xanthine dehydrogenase YagR molybdenum-binding subunit